MIGLIIWGSRSESLDLGVVDHRYCNTCRGIRPFKIILQYRYFHICWIFGWIMSKEYVLACDFCYKGWILKPSEVEKNFFRHPIPFMRRYGLLFLGAFFLILMASSIVSSPLETVDSKLSPSNSTASTPPLTIQPSQNTSTPTYSRPFLADSGHPFPSISGYIAGYPRQLQDGYSSITIDNSRSDSDVFVKLFSLGTRSLPVQVFFIRAHDIFTIESMRAGQYDIRYRNLNSGLLLRTDPFELHELIDQTGVTYSDFRLSLYTVNGGNMQVHQISEQEF